MTDLTLLNTSMSNKSTFVRFFLLKSPGIQRLFVQLLHENLPSLLTMLKCMGRFCFYGYMAKRRIPFIKTYSTAQKLVQLLKAGGMEIIDEEKVQH